MKTAIVTGATGALGSAVVQRLAADGFQVYGTVMRDVELETYSGVADLSVVDLTDFESVKGWIHGIGQSIHAAALIAGGFAMRSLGEFRADDFDQMFDMNVRTASNVLNAVTPVLGQPAAVVLVGAAVYQGAKGMSLYAASKAAVVSLARSAALELQDNGVRVNTILPNIIDTPANREAMPKADFDKWAKPEELADVIAYLVSDQARVVSGNAITVGRTVG
jgi:NAD(P)-dependent dehydrogenase (short-subunit alcohol dehydrogenase family)